MSFDSLTIEELGRLRDQATAAINEINYRGALRHIKTIAEEISYGQPKGWTRATQIIDIVDAALGLNPKLPGYAGRPIATIAQQRQKLSELTEVDAATTD